MDSRCPLRWGNLSPSLSLGLSPNLSLSLWGSLSGSLSPGLSPSLSLSLGGAYPRAYGGAYRGAYPGAYGGAYPPAYGRAYGPVSCPSLSWACFLVYEGVHYGVYCLNSTQVNCIVSPPDRGSVKTAARQPT